MITIVARFEDGWFGKDVDYFMWKQLCHAYNVDRLIMVGKTDNNRIVDRFDSMKECLDSLINSNIVLLEPTGSKELSEFLPPDDVVYVFGNALNHNREFSGNHLRIKTPNKTDMFSTQAAAIVLNHHVSR